jgi:hypothetical protein
VLANPSNEPVTETVLVANSKLMNNSPVNDLLHPERGHTPFLAGLLEVSLQPWETRLLQPNTQAERGYTTYKRVR